MANPQKTIYVALFDGFGRKNKDGVASGAAMMYEGGSQANGIAIFTGLLNRRYSDRTLSNVVNHELGHTAGLLHIWELGRVVNSENGQNPSGETNATNLMNSESNPNTEEKPSRNGDPLMEGELTTTDEQINEVIETVENEQQN